ncbi:hypothetical protein [Streptomyces laculatispora]|uniref:hypothetical protein n=1 Tax=Streptomyces laculatispora TaxID=887464 RepID=UPI0027DD9758|nr:hypothetical protein [Streptomyces laculatispora]
MPARAERARDQSAAGGTEGVVQGSGVVLGSGDGDSVAPVVSLGSGDGESVAQPGPGFVVVGSGSGLVDGSGLVPGPCRR